MNFYGKPGEEKYPVEITVEQFVESAEKRDVSPLTIEGRIIFYLTQNGQSRIKEVMLASKSSYRGFYLALGKLKTKGVVEIANDPRDKRARLVQLC